jgi:hypothetical protein
MDSTKFSTATAPIRTIAATRYGIILTSLERPVLQRGSESCVRDMFFSTWIRVVPTHTGFTHLGGAARAGKDDRRALALAYHQGKAVTAC